MHNIIYLLAWIIFGNVIYHVATKKVKLEEVHPTHYYATWFLLAMSVLCFYLEQHGR